MGDELVSIPPDLTLLSDDELADLEARAIAEFDRVKAEPDISAELLEYQMRLASGVDSVRAEKAGREVRARQAAEDTRARLLEQQASLEARVHGRPPEGGAGDGASGGGDGSPHVDAAAIAKAAAEGATAALVAAIGQRGRLDQAAVTQRATASLADVRRAAPAVIAPTRRLAVTAGVDIPGVARGAEMASLDELVSAMQRAAKGMPVTRDGSGQERLVATIRNEFEHVVDDRTTPQQVEELLTYLRRPEKMESLVAGGGWCAPSEIRYEFFNVAGVDGLVDLPTVGISRGGLRFPISPTIADAFGGGIGLAPFNATFTNASDPWLWTETDDIASVTGSPTKPTIRVACPSFSEQRLECYGITLTAGNLTDDAYPEATAHTLRLLLTAWQHAQNARIISQMVAQSTTSVTVSGSGVQPVYQTVLNGISMCATDYRAKFAIPDNVVLEAVAPFWLKDVIQADLAWRNSLSTELLAITDAQIDAFFAEQGVRCQWVNDWQVRGSGQFGNASATKNTWPTSAQVMLYAAGTFIKGNGLTLDLGVVRDSVLNKTNDFTAAWSEECHLVAKVGNESRLITFGFGVNGATGNGFYAAGSPGFQV